VSKDFEKSIITQRTYLLLDSSKRPIVSVRQIRADIVLPVIYMQTDQDSRRHWFGIAGRK